LIKDSINYSDFIRNVLRKFLKMTLLKDQQHTADFLISIIIFYDCWAQTRIFPIFTLIF